MGLGKDGNVILIPLAALLPMAWYVTLVHLLLLYLRWSLFETA